MSQKTQRMHALRQLQIARKNKCLWAVLIALVCNAPSAVIDACKEVIPTTTDFPSLED